MGTKLAQSRSHALAHLVSCPDGDVSSMAKECTPPPSDPTKRPRRPSSVHWSDGLVYAMEDPEQVFEEDDLTVTLKDGFPKARYTTSLFLKKISAPLESSVTDTCPYYGTYKIRQSI